MRRIRTTADREAARLLRRIQRLTGTRIQIKRIQTPQRTTPLTRDIALAEWAVLTQISACVKRCRALERERG